MRPYAGIDLIAITLSGGKYAQSATLATWTPQQLPAGAVPPLVASGSPQTSTVYGTRWMLKNSLTNFIGGGSMNESNHTRSAKAPLKRQGVPLHPLFQTSSGRENARS